MNNLLHNFQNEVVLKYHLYNALFLTLPFNKTEETGALLPIFSKFCQKQIIQKQSPQQIIANFFKQQLPNASDKERITLLFRFLQFVERQIVLFDALEDAAFSKTHHMLGPGSIHNLLLRVENQHREKQFTKELPPYKVRIVLTAHPTQFYPAPILGILTQLQKALRKDKLESISALLLQMGKTSFKHLQKPTPYEEAESLVWYLKKIFYPVIPHIQTDLEAALQNFGYTKKSQPYIDIGFWPGGDRDGNPYVTAETTLAVAKLLKISILTQYHVDLKRLLKKLTFVGILEPLEEIKNKIEQTLLAMKIPEKNPPHKGIYRHADELLLALKQVKKILVDMHNGLFIEVLDLFITKVRCFGFYFAAMDIRENSAIYRVTFHKILDDLYKKSDQTTFPSKQYVDLPPHKKAKIIKDFLRKKFKYQYSEKEQDSLFINTIKSFKAIKKIQDENGENGLCRIVISNSSSAFDVLELLAMLHLTGEFKNNIPVDIIPLFESIIDLHNAKNIMEQLFENDLYRDHLEQRKQMQTVMLGFSDGTKDGGYVAANWAIYKTKLELTKLAKTYGIHIIFFDGRGGPPARGGGNTNAFYRSLGNNISHQELQLTVQGQTISSNFGTTQSAKFNIEQLFTAGLEDHIFPEKTANIPAKEMILLDELAKESFNIYNALKNNPLFVPYLEKMTPLRFFSELNIGSRPASRKSSKTLHFSELRAIPFVGSWSQLKQNIPGYYGFGSALKKLNTQGKTTAVHRFYQHSLFFRTLVENAMMSLSKSFFPLTAYMKNDKKFSKFWQRLQKESQLTIEELLDVSQQKYLLANDEMNRTSIQLREEIVLPLLIIQQYAMIELNKTKDKKLISLYKNMVLKALAANTNASRNSA